VVVIIAVAVVVVVVIDVVVVVVPDSEISSLFIHSVLILMHYLFYNSL